MISTFVSSLSDLSSVANLSLVQDVLLEPRELTRLGKLSLATAIDLAKQARQLNINPILVWDVLFKQEGFKKVAQKLKELDLSIFKAVRVADVGAAHWVLNNTSCDIELICEAGSHNVVALCAWCRIFGQRLIKLCVSHEIPEGDLANVCKNVPCPIEILGAGRIELFYSPRLLLSRNFSVDELGYKEVVASSNESHNRPFPVVQSPNGTMMYLHRDRFVLDRFAKFKEIGVASLRVDLRHLSSLGNAADGISEVVMALEQGREPEWGCPKSTPFRHANNTLRSSARIRRKLDRIKLHDCLAQVVASESEDYTVFQAIRSSNVSSRLALLLPTGETMSLPGVQFKNTQLQIMDDFIAGQVLITPWIRKAVPGSVLIRVEDSLVELSA